MKKHSKILIHGLFATSLLLGTTVWAKRDPERDRGRERIERPTRRDVNEPQRERERPESEELEARRRQIHMRELAQHRRELQERIHQIELELEGLRDDQDEEARELQAELHELRSGLRRVQRQLRDSEQERRPEAEEVDSPLGRAVKYIQIFKPLKPLTPYKLMEQIEKMHARLAELKEAAEHAEREGQYDKTAELRKKARRIAEQLEAHVHAFAFEFRQVGKLHEAKKRLERLRHKAHAAQERGEAEKTKRFMVEAEELEQALRHEFEHLETANSLERLRLMAHEAEERGEIEKARDILADAEGLEGLRRELERRRVPRHWPERDRYMPELGGTRIPPEMERHFKEALEAHIEQMEKHFKRILAEHIESMQKQNEELRAEVDRLKRLLEQWRE